jgi:hypothetical protein
MESDPDLLEDLATIQMIASSFCSENKINASIKVQLSKTFMIFLERDTLSYTKYSYLVSVQN